MAITLNDEFIALENLIISLTDRKVWGGYNTECLVLNSLVHSFLRQVL